MTVSNDRRCFVFVEEFYTKDGEEVASVRKRHNLFTCGSFNEADYSSGRSQWPRRLRRELSSLARTLGSWVLIPLKACMPVCVYSVFR
jgi:hypothetical protein